MSCIPAPRDALIIWVGFLNPNYQLPPIGDPAAFLAFARSHTSGGERNQQWQNRESHGDLAAGAVIYQVLMDHKIYGVFCRASAALLKSNLYWAKLTCQNRLADLCVGHKNGMAANSFKVSELGDVFEVRPVSAHMFH